MATNNAINSTLNLTTLGAYSVVGNSTGSSGQAARVQTSAYVPSLQAFTSGSSATYTTPAGCTWIRVRIWGGGAGGGSGNVGGTGGGSGAYCESIITSPAATYTYTVAASVAAATNGNASTFSAGTMSAGGGTAGSDESGGAGGVASVAILLI